MHNQTSSDGNPPELLTVAQFAARFNGAIGKNRIYELVKSGQIRSITLGERKRLIPASELTDWPARAIKGAL